MRVIDIISSSLRIINCLASGEPLPGPEAADALVVMQDMFDSWNAQSLAVFQELRTVVTPGALKQTYTVGTGGDFNIPRPPRLEKIGVISLQNVAQPLELPLDRYTQDEWMLIPVKNIQSSLPRAFWNDDAFPLMNVNFWPIPNVAIQFALYPWSQLTSSGLTLGADVTLPPAYAIAVKFNLAVWLAPEWGRAANIPPLVVQKANESFGIVKALNIKPVVARCDPALANKGGGTYNWLTDGPITR